MSISAIIYFKYSLDKIIFPGSTFFRLLLILDIFLLLTKRWWQKGLYWMFTAKQNEYEDYI